ALVQLTPTTVRGRIARELPLAAQLPTVELTERARSPVCPSDRSASVCAERLAQPLDHARRCAHANPRALVVVRLGQHGRSLVDEVNEPLVRPWDVELGFLQRADEVLDET